MGANVVNVPLVDYTYNLKGILAAIDETTKMVLICNPNNPTGTAVGKEALIQFIKEVPENIIVLNTFSKIYVLAVLRIGYGIGRIPLIKIHRVKEPFNVNHLAQVGALAEPH